MPWKTERKIYYVAQRGYMHNGEMLWCGEWSNPDLQNVQDFLTKFHVRPDEKTRIIKVTITETHDEWKQTNENA